MFQWMEVLAQGPVAKAILALSIVAAGGLAFGSLGVRGIRLGAAGVLFAGIFFGQLGMHIDERILEFVRDFGLLLFVYTVGLQVGPGFFSSVKQRGLQLNALGAAIVLLGGLIVAGFRFLFHFSVPVVGGLFAGATTNTPSLAAAQAALQSRPGLDPAAGDFLGMAYAVAYPFGIVGIIVTMLLVRRVFSIDVDLEARTVELSAQTSERTPDLHRSGSYQSERGRGDTPGSALCCRSWRRLLTITPERQGDGAGRRLCHPDLETAFDWSVLKRSF
jgi:putative transport protein